MNYINFERKYERAGLIGRETTICLWKHNNGTVCEIDFHWMENFVYVSFVDGPTLTVQFKGSVIEVGLHDDFRKRDLSTHPSWTLGNRQLLVKLYLRHILGSRTTWEQREALWDIVSNEIKF